MIEQFIVRDEFGTFSVWPSTNDLEMWVRSKFEICQDCVDAKSHRCRRRAITTEHMTRRFVEICNDLGERLYDSIYGDHDA